MRLNISQVLLFEAIIVVTLIGVLTGLAARSYSKTVKVVTVFEALSLSVLLKQDVYTYFAFYGMWPDSVDLKNIPQYVDESKGIKKVEVVRGSFFITYNEKHFAFKNKVLAFRKAQFIGVPGSPVNWLCGYQQVPKGMTVDVENKTTISKEYMPKGCV